MRHSTKAWAAAVAGLVLLAGGTGAGAAPAGHPERAPLAAAVSKVDRSTQWSLINKIRLTFPTYHPQGLARVGDRLFLSSVEIIEAPVRYPQPIDGYDRTPGRGRGHVFVLDLHGHLLADVIVGEGTRYHPGGIDADTSALWVPVAEYRPNSAAIIYRIDLATLAVHEAFRVADHIGGIVPDPASGQLHGVSWGSRTLYTWTRTGHQLDRRPNPSHFIDYQDCAAVDRRALLCTGITTYTTPTGAGFELGGLALIDLPAHTIRHEAPVQLWSPANHTITRNPVHLEADRNTLRMWAAPDDGEEAAGTEILVYQATIA